jgi:hypothetical protein
MRYLGTFATRSLGPSRTGVFARDDDAIIFFLCAADAGLFCFEHSLLRQVKG